jgi:dienelactone hydrolase
MPLNARVWYPEGAGPFPLLLIVHGNHRMQDFSDPGYAYLGEHLASHGYIVASVDENFLNAGPSSNLAMFGVEPLSGDNGARGVLLLEHLRLFRAWNAEPGNPFQGKVDLERIALAGHSRGGEAIAAATAFNRLSCYPEDASIRFDYGFNIRSLVAISTTDKLYTPGGPGIALENVNYLALQGSNDGDVPYFMGMQQFERLRFTDGQPRFKAAVYIHRANHGQFNTVWGRYDKSTFPKNLFFNRKPLLSAQEQQRIANVFITAFLDVTLQGKREYTPLFQDYRVGARWLPDTIYLNRYRESGFRFVAAYDEDLELTTTTLPGGTIAGENLVVWREHPPGGQARWSALDTRSVYLGWDRRDGAEVASYSITLPPAGLPLGPDSVLFFALADANEEVPTAGRRGRGARQPIDLTIELVDGAGTTARLPLSHVSLLQPQLDARLWKGWFSERAAPGIVFKTFLMPMSEMLAASPSFDPGTLEAVRLVFDRTRSGVVVLDNLGFKP